MSMRFHRLHCVILELTHCAHARSEDYCSCPVCMYVCVCGCTYACPLISAASHIGITKEGYQRVHSNTGIVLIFADFPKITLFKS